MTVRALTFMDHAVGIHVSEGGQTRPGAVIRPCQTVCTSQNMVIMALNMVIMALNMVNMALFGTVLALFGTPWYTVHAWDPEFDVSTQ